MVVRDMNFDNYLACKGRYEVTSDEGGGGLSPKY